MISATPGMARICPTAPASNPGTNRTSTFALVMPPPFVWPILTPPPNQPSARTAERFWRLRKTATFGFGEGTHKMLWSSGYPESGTR